MRQGIDEHERSIVVDLWLSVVTRQLLAVACSAGRPLTPEVENGAYLAAIDILTELTHAGFGLVLVTGSDYA